MALPIMFPLSLSLALPCLQPPAAPSPGPGGRRDLSRRILGPLPRHAGGRAIVAFRFFPPPPTEIGGFARVLRPLAFAAPLRPCCRCSINQRVLSSPLLSSRVCCRLLICFRRAGFKGSCRRILSFSNRDFGYSSNNIGVNRLDI
jgi:hypothetical protein